MVLSLSGKKAVLGAAHGIFALDSAFAVEREPLDLSTIGLSGSSRYLPMVYSRR
jgi:hypothetical protein